MTRRLGLVPPDSAVHREVRRLYRIAQSLRPVSGDLWNGDLYAVDGDVWGTFDPKSGAMSLSQERVLRHLTGSPPHRQHAQAVATVLHESTHAGMTMDAPDEHNAVRSPESIGVMEGLAEYRTVRDFQAFAQRAGFPHLRLDVPQYRGLYAATADVIEQVTGPRLTPGELLDRATRGPVAMHFDQLADAALRNRLDDVVPPLREHHRAVRAALIEELAHPLWPTLKGRVEEPGLMVAGEIRQHLDATIRQIREHYRRNPHQPVPVDWPNSAALNLPSGDAEVAAMAKESVVPPQAGEHLIVPPERDREGASISVVGKAPGGHHLDEPKEFSDRQGTGPTGPRSPGEMRPVAPSPRSTFERTSSRNSTPRRNEFELRFLSGQAPAAGAVERRPTLGQGERGAGTSEVGREPTGRFGWRDGGSVDGRDRDR